jgi:translation initiation factor eIF-2B subunit alpha
MLAHDTSPSLTPNPRHAAGLNDAVVKEFHDAINKSSDMAVAVAAIKALTSVIKNSSAQTMMGLEKELKDAAAALQR